MFSFLMDLTTTMGNLIIFSGDYDDVSSSFVLFPLLNLSKSYLHDVLTFSIWQFDRIVYIFIDGYPKIDYCVRFPNQ